MKDFRYMTIVALAAVGLALGACGGGSDDSSMMPDPPPMPDPDPPPPPPVVSVTIPDAMYLDAANMPMADEMEIAAGETWTNNGVVFSCPADGDACEVEVMADGSVTSTGGEATAMLTADARMQVDTAIETARLMRRDRVIGEDRALEAAANLGLTSTAGVDEDEIRISRAPGAMARVTVANATPAYSAADNPALPNGDWAGSRLMQTVPGASNQLVVYTDIEAPTRIQFYNWDGDAMTPSLYADAAVTDALTTPADAGTVITPLALDTGGGSGQAFSARVADLTRFPAAPSPEEGSDTQTYRVNDASTAGGANDRVSIPGNFNGAGGRYLCTPASGATCSVTVAPSGAYTSGDTWTFVPELNSTAWVQDGGNAAGAGGGQQGDFMSFGWWLRMPTAQTGAYTFQYYADGTAYQLAAGNLAAGSATYTGRAAGRYAMQEIDDTGVVDGMAGEFTAAASLTARFNGTAAGGTLEGTISGFQGDGGMDMSGWSVALARQTITGANAANVTSAGTVNDPDLATFDGATATLGGETLHGTWVSQFFGLPANDGGSTDAYPLGVGGTFQADNEAASIAGAFGARR